MSCCAALSWAKTNVLLPTPLPHATHLSLRYAITVKLTKTTLALRLLLSLLELRAKLLHVASLDQASCAWIPQQAAGT